MAKKVFAMYLAKEGNPNSDACAKLDLPASPWELWDALDKVRLQKDDILYMEIEDYYTFEYLAPNLDGFPVSNCRCQHGVMGQLNSLYANTSVDEFASALGAEGITHISQELFHIFLREKGLNVCTECFDPGG